MWTHVRANLKALRAQHKLSQHAAAVAIGVQQVSWARWESETIDRRPSADSLMKVAALFNVTVESLFQPPAASSRKPGPSFKRKTK